jgi:RNA polymerase-binding transcription factor DksA
MPKSKPAPAANTKAKDTAPAKSTGKPADKADKGGKVNGSSQEEAPKARKISAPEESFTTAHVKMADHSKLSPFLRKQKERLLQLRDSMLDSMMGVAKDNLRTRAEGSEASAFGMHQADAGSDAYDRDFALSLLSQEQDALYEIEEALKRIDLGTYGVCEMSGKAIAHPRLEALPFARFTVECQSQIEKQGKVSRARVPVTSLFGLTDSEETAETEEEETPTTEKE